MNKKHLKYDFLGSAYINTTPEDIKLSLMSIHNQTYQPQNIVLVFDGPINKVTENLISEYSKFMKLKLIHLKKNLGFGLALKKGLEYCTSPIVLRFDTDDYNIKDRAIIQIKAFEESDADIIGGHIQEFQSNLNEIKGQRNVPLNHSSIKKQIYFKNPMNHTTVAFKKEKILALNTGYRKFDYYEDYDLWIRSLANGLRFKNIDKVLVKMKKGSQLNRRTGIKMIYMETKLLISFMNLSIIAPLFFLPAYLIRVILLAYPSFLTKKIYSILLRR